MEKGIDPETRIGVLLRSLLALGCGAAYGVGWLVWKPGAWVVQAFKDLLEDETHLDKIKKRMKGEG